MRIAAIAVIGSLGLAVSAFSASAAPLAPGKVDQGSNIVQVAGGCGPGWHPNRWGRCMPNRNWHRHGPRWGAYYPRRHTPSDFVANRLNAQELARSGGGVYHRGPGWGY
jgi:hypothetical protein